MSTETAPNANTLRASEQIRREFIDFFAKERQHTFWPSSPVAPLNDPTLLFANAGMNQFKPIFLGQADPSSDLGAIKRAVNSQKCIRAGGKHNDLEDVGRDTYHHTFFEMLGNWSFGDYFKDEAIRWAWGLLVERWGLDPERLCATYFGGDEGQGLAPDDDARDLWLRFLPKERVLAFGMKDNFWEMGDTGPCGPCSEIHYDSRPDAERVATPMRELVNRDHPDVIEIWNLVFIQFDRQASGLKPLPARHVDTGLGLERITRVLQGRRSNYDTDLFTPIFARIREIIGCGAYTGELEKREDIAYRVIADHARALTFAITDGATPGNEGRGYVLRRILRRAFRHGRQTLRAEGPFLHELVPTIVKMMGEAFPELREHPQRVAAIIREEEEAFGRTLDRGINYFKEMLQQACVQHVECNTDARKYAAGHPRKIEFIDVPTRRVLFPLLLDWSEYPGSRPMLKGRAAFKLHDTYGFPIDLTCVMAEERGLRVDVEGFERLMEEAREKARAGSARGAADTAANLPAEAIGSLNKMGVRPTDDGVKYDPDLKPCRARVRAIWNGGDFDEAITSTSTRPGERVAVILDRTNFYAESGGQVGDAGRLLVTREARTSVSDKHEGGEFKVEDTRAVGGYVLHVGRVARGEIRTGDEVECRLDKSRRRPTMANHTATHMLNFALREALGAGIEQKGSLVAPDRLRFDFSHDAALSDEEIERVERIVRERIAADEPVFTALAPLDTAQKINGVRAVFGEAYPDPVRVVSVGAPVEPMLDEPESPLWRTHPIEFCGGTHLASSGEAGAFAITSEEAVARGVRRIEALTGEAANEAIAAGQAALSSAQAAIDAPADQLRSAVDDVAARLQARALPARARRQAHALLDKAQARLRDASKAQARAGRAGAVAQARDIAAKAAGDVVVARVEAGGDRQALLAALDAVVAKKPDGAAMLFSVDSESSKVAIVARVAPALIAKGLKAGEWVRTASQAVGGKGGGKPDSAQGGGAQPENVETAISAARDFAADQGV